MISALLISYGGNEPHSQVLKWLFWGQNKQFNKISLWRVQISIEPSIVLVDKGTAKTLTTSTAKEDIYAFIFGQEGLMAGIGLQGSKITKIDPDK